MKYWVLLALCYWLAGCHGEVWRADNRFTDEERGHIEQGADLWAPYGKQVFVVFEKVTDQENTGRLIIRATNRTARAHGIDSLAPGKHFPENLGKEKIVLVPERLKWVPLWQVAAHEFGHSFGMKHVEDERALMYGGSVKHGVTMQCITKADLNELCRIGECVNVSGCDE